MGLALLAQAEMATPTTIVGAFIFVALCLVGLVGWILKHLFLTTIPGLIQTAETKHQALVEEVKAQRESHETIIGQLCKTFEVTNAAERKMCADETALLNTSMASLTGAIREREEQIVARVNEHTTDSAGKYRHDIYDQIHAAIMRRSVEGAKQEREKRKAERGDLPVKPAKP